MKVARSNILIGFMALIIAMLTWALVFYARDEFSLAATKKSEAIPTKSAVSKENGFARIVLNRQSQEASGIAMAALADFDSADAVQVYGTVVDPQPLFSLRAQYLAALAQVRTQRVAVANSEDEYRRLERLYADDRNVSERALLVAQTQWRAEQARLAAAEQAAAALKEELRAHWGQTIAGWASESNAKVFDGLSSQREVLVQVSIPFELRERAAKAELKVGPVGANESLREARFVSPAHQSDATLTGATFLYLTDARDLRTGMRVSGRMELEGGARDGVLIPQAAIVWHAGKAWCYVQEEPEEFLRREVSTREELPGGWFNTEGFEAGDKVVVRGAQLLLSEEQKFQIREENDD